MEIQPHNLWYTDAVGTVMLIGGSILMALVSIIVVVFAFDTTIALGGWIYSLLGWLVPLAGIYFGAYSPENTFAKLSRNYDNLWKFQRELPKELKASVKIYTAGELADLDEDTVRNILEKNRTLLKKYNEAKVAAGTPGVQGELQNLDSLIEDYEVLTTTYKELL